LMKGTRQPYRTSRNTTNGGVSAPPSREPACVKPCTNPRSAGRTQRDRDRVAMGKAPASPTPNRKRIVAIDAAPQAAAVIEVKTDHHMTIAEKARRGPIQSPSQPLGIWNSA